jgi:DNA-binding NarL/FixJ family response regulator
VSRPRVLLADDHPIVAEGLKNLLASEFELVAVVENGRALVEGRGSFGPTSSWRTSPCRG